MKAAYHKISGFLILLVTLTFQGTASCQKYILELFWVDICVKELQKRVLTHTIKFLDKENKPAHKLEHQGDHILSA